MLVIPIPRIVPHLTQLIIFILINARKELPNWNRLWRQLPALFSFAYGLCFLLVWGHARPGKRWPQHFLKVFFVSRNKFLSHWVISWQFFPMKLEVFSNGRAHLSFRGFLLILRGRSNGASGPYPRHYCRISCLCLFLLYEYIWEDFDAFLHLHNLLLLLSLFIIPIICAQISTRIIAPTSGQAKAQ